MFAGLANFVIPLMLGADDMAFPRLNALSFWMLPTAGVMMVASLFWQGFGAGWTAYAPLASDYQSRLAAVLQHRRAVRRHSSILTAINFIVTILTMRAPGMTLWRMPLLVWAQPDDLGAGRARHAVHRRVAVHAALRPRHAHGLLQLQGRRAGAAVPARLLVLLTPGRLHHDAARLRHHLRGDLGDGAQADLRLPRRRLLDDLRSASSASRSGRTTCSSPACRPGCASRS